jgi:GTP-binding protein
MSKLWQARFFTTVNQLRDLPDTQAPEIAFAGRSNAGKSTAINILTNQKGLAFASKTPGRTQHINYFSIGGAQVGQHRKDATIVEEIDAALVLIMDSRRPFTELDVQMLEWFAPTGKPIHCILTKADKLNRNESTNVLRQARMMLESYVDEDGEGFPFTVQLFSALKRVGIDEANDKIVDLLGLTAVPADPDAVLVDPVDSVDPLDRDDPAA